jgi:DNA-binding MarR family transcriptional regulator
MIVGHLGKISGPHSPKDGPTPTSGCCKPDLRRLMTIREFKKKPFLLVPVINENAKACPLTPQETLVYGYLLFRAKKERASSKTEIRRSLRLDARAVEKSLRLLVDAGLVSAEGRRTRALEPHGDSRGWFRYQRKPCGGWQNRFVYDKVYLPCSSKTLSVRTNALFWHLVKLGRPVQGMPGYLKVGDVPGSFPAYLSHVYLARGLGMCRKTVARGLGRLIQLGLVTVYKRDHNEWYVGVLPLAKQSHLWRDAWQQSAPKVPVTAKELFGFPSSASLKAAVQMEKPLMRKLLQHDIHGPLAVRIVEFSEQLHIDPGEWMDLLTRAHQRHQSNREKNPSLPAHCGILFEAMLKDHVKSREARHQERWTPPDIEELTARDALEAMNAPDDAINMLAMVVEGGAIPFDGGVVPSSLSWEAVEKVAKKANGKFPVFQKAIDGMLFDNCDDGRCPWLDAWRSLE